MLRYGRVGAPVVVAGMAEAGAMAEAGGMVEAAILEEVTAGAVTGAEGIMVVEVTGAVTGEATIVAGVMRPMAWAWG
jgi:hypothetical protein